jgi:mannose-6-phosphate isomerase-like protein (cupin superfamily)
MTAQTPPPEALWFLNSRIEVLRSSADGPDGSFLQLQDMPPGDSPPTHVHHNEDEVFHVLDGELKLKVGEEIIQLKARQSATAPKGVPHGFTVVSPQGARVIVLTVGQDFERMIREVARPAQGPGRPGPMAPTREAIAALEAATARNGITLVGPPLG